MLTCLDMAALSLGLLGPNGHTPGNQRRSLCFSLGNVRGPVGNEARLRAQVHIPSKWPQTQEGAAYGCLSLGRGLGVMPAPKSRGHGEPCPSTTRLEKTRLEPAM